MLESTAGHAQLQISGMGRRLSAGHVRHPVMTQLDVFEIAEKRSATMPSDQHVILLSLARLVMNVGS